MGLGRHLRRAALLAGFACATPVALAATPVARADGLLAPSGSLVYSWHGDPARGCAAVGVCGIQGVLLVRPNSPAFVFAPGHGIPAMVDVTGASATVRVRRSETGSSGDCVDTSAWLNTGASGLALSWRPNGRARLTIPSAGGPSSGRCAGPRAGDLSGVVTGRAGGGRHPSFWFVATSNFTVGPYSGTLVSTLGFRPVSGGGSVSDGGSGSSSPGGHPKLAPFEQVILRIRMRTPAASLTAQFHGGTDATCVVFDSCATTGAVALGLGAAQQIVTVSAQHRVTHPVSRARALADFRAGLLTEDLPLNGSGAVVRTTETLDRSGGAPCRDTSAEGSPLQFWLGSPFAPQTGPRIPVSITADPGGIGLLRTRCAGPEAFDVFGSGATSSGGPLVLARGSINRSTLLAAHATVALSAQGSFIGPGYRGTRIGSLTVGLTLLKVTAGTVREPAG